MEMAKRIGRPRAYETVEELEDAIERYFEAVGVDELYPVPSRTGLNYFLQISRNTFYDMARDPTFEYALTMAVMRCEMWEAHQLVTRSTGSVEGLKFSLSNNYGWKARSEVEFGGETREALARSLPMSEKAAFILGAQSEMQKAQAKLLEMQARATPGTDENLEATAIEVDAEVSDG